MAAATTSDRPRIELVPAEDLVPEMQRRLHDVQEALGIPIEAAGPLLRTQGWSVQSLLQQYFDNPDQLLKEAGVSQRCCQQEGEEGD